MCQMEGIDQATKEKMKPSKAEVRRWQKEAESYLRGYGHYGDQFGFVRYQRRVLRLSNMILDSKKFKLTIRAGLY